MATPGNPNGAVPIFDGGNPAIITAKARAVVSGGEFVFISGATGVVGSGVDTYATSDLKVALVASAERFTGIALNNAASGASVSVARNGDYLLKCGGSVFGGALVESIGDSVAVQTLSSGAVPSALHAGVPGAKIIGRAVTDGASGGFALVHIWG